MITPPRTLALVIYEEALTLGTVERAAVAYRLAESLPPDMRTALGSEILYHQEGPSEPQPFSPCPGATGRSLSERVGAFFLEWDGWFLIVMALLVIFGACLSVTRP